MICNPLFQENPNCLLIVTPAGGHLGWVAGDEAPFGAPWTDPVIMEYLEHIQNEKYGSNTSSFPDTQVSDMDRLQHIEV